MKLLYPSVMNYVEMKLAYTLEEGFSQLFLLCTELGTDIIPSRWLESLHSSEPSTSSEHPLAAPTQSVDDHRSDGPLQDA